MSDHVTVEYVNFVVAMPPALPTPSSALVLSDEVYSEEHLNQGPYNQYLIDSKYSTDTGLRVIPKAANGEDKTVLNSVVRIHRGTSDKVVVWTVERCNKKPQLPELSTKNPNEIPISQEITFANKYQLLNGNTVYRVSGVNYYKLLKPLDQTSTYPIGTTPAEVSPSSANSYTNSDFVGTILDAAFASPSGVRLQIPIRVGI